MKDDKINIGNKTFKFTKKPVKGEIVQLENESYYKISNYNRMPPFLMNIVSDSDLWMFISSNGALTAGRRDADHALFPYYTDDRIHDSADITGSKTILFVNKEDKIFLWQPFSSKHEGLYDIERNIYKNITGNKLIFEEINFDLSVSFQYAWLNCDEFGFIKRSRIINLNNSSININILDGIQNILPYGGTRKFQIEFSTLLDGYKKNELVDGIGLGLYTLSSIPTDKAEPSEALKANTVWSTGLDKKIILLSESQINQFKFGQPLAQETDVRAKRGAYFIQTEFELKADGSKEWYIVADLDKDSADVACLSNLLHAERNLTEHIKSEVCKSSSNLNLKVASADAFQLTNDQLVTFRHYSNVLFNIMRGGIFDEGYTVNKSDFLLFVRETNSPVSESHKTFLETLPEAVNFKELLKLIEDMHDEDLERICLEYLPLSFSRRHGDPSRPWNHFSIIIKDEKGNRILNYEGNWRDIFQNWEALAYSFPGFIENMIVKFVNSSTADGYNPYKVTRNGFDWEVIDPSNPWANIGYWGDHQIVYLLKLLELSVKFHPGLLKSFLSKEIFVYANVPYRQKSYNSIVEDPHNTIDFDSKLDAEIRQKVKRIGEDGKFIQDKKGGIYHVNLTEKLLVMLLAKLSNFIPEAGIWMNTQRPEWNDANNALVGFGTSMVTLYYLRGFLEFCIKLYDEIKNEKINVSEEVFDLFSVIHQVMIKHNNLLTGELSDHDRRVITNELGIAGSDYRLKIYSNNFSGNRKPLDAANIVSFCKIALSQIDHSICANKREDNLYHSYNLIKFNRSGEVQVRHLYEMLEGQVAVLSSGYLSVEESIILIEALKNSALYRKDQFSYLLYPDRQLKRFTDKNLIPVELINQSHFLQTLAADNDGSIIIKDVNGNFHFNSNFVNAAKLKQALNLHDDKLTDVEKQKVLDIYESVFDHQSFTGRSGTFYKYEGLGSIYWHMVSKLLLAVQRTYTVSLEKEANGYALEKLKNSYYKIKEGIGSHKPPELYGAFPIDPYSHTPGNMGAQQPGMTGQVKEDIISRFGELGISINNGKIKFSTSLIKENEFLEKSMVYLYYDLNGKYQTLMLNAGMVAYTFCQVPIIYIISKENKIVITRNNGSEEEVNGAELDENCSRSIFERSGRIIRIKVLINIIKI